MKRIVDSGWGIVVLAGLILLSHTASFAKEAVNPYAWDFGKVKQGEVVAHSFTLKNDSAETLNIVAVNTSCGCAVSEVKDKVLAPQGSTLLEVKFNSKGYSGAVQQFIYVNTDSVDKPVVRFIIKAEVVK